MWKYVWLKFFAIAVSSCCFRWLSDGYKARNNDLMKYPLQKQFILARAVFIMTRPSMLYTHYSIENNYKQTNRFNRSWVHCATFSPAVFWYFVVSQYYHSPVNEQLTYSIHLYNYYPLKGCKKRVFFSTVYTQIGKSAERIRRKLKHICTGFHI